MEKRKGEGGGSESEAEVPVKPAGEAIFDSGASQPSQVETAEDEGGSADDRPLWVNVPEDCKTPKGWFRDEPSAEIVKEIRDYVAEHGESHTWRGHTHSRPPDRAVVKYIARFELPEKFQRAKQFLVCPICRPNSRNFGKRDGFIAWFPDEGVIRLIGPDCFAEINKEGHEDAVRELRERERRDSDTSFLVSQRDQHRLALNVLTASRRVARALDTFGADVRRTLYETLDVDLWDHVRTGELQTVKKLANPNRAGQFLYVPQRFGALDGHRLLDPAAKKLESKFQEHISFLDEVLSVFDDQWSQSVDQLEASAREAQVRKLGKSLDAARDLRAAVSDLRAFLAPANLATLRRWGSSDTEGRPVDVYARRDGAQLRVGSSEQRNMAVQIPPDLDLDIPSVSALTARRP